MTVQLTNVEISNDDTSYKRCNLHDDTTYKRCNLHDDTTYKRCNLQWRYNLQTL